MKRILPLYHKAAKSNLLKTRICAILQKQRQELGQNDCEILQEFIMFVHMSKTWKGIYQKYAEWLLKCLYIKFQKEQNIIYP